MNSSSISLESAFVEGFLRFLSFSRFVALLSFWTVILKRHNFYLILVECITRDNDDDDDDEQHQRGRYEIIPVQLSHRPLERRGPVPSLLGFAQTTGNDD